MTLGDSDSGCSCGGSDDKSSGTEKNHVTV